MAALVRQPPKPHDQMKIGKPKKAKKRTRVATPSPSAAAKP
jgi:hypothetical protein